MFRRPPSSRAAGPSSPRRLRFRRLAALTGVLVAGWSASPLPAQERPTWPDFVKHSEYVEMSDGVRLAVDVFRPARGARAEEQPLPLVWTHDRYHRATDAGGRVFDKMRSGTLRTLVRHGYVVAAVDVRGAGASFGRFTAPFSVRETEDARELLDWFAAQDWCDGSIGMWGGSYLGATQYLAATTGSPHLKAIMPSVAPADLYGFCYAGGIYRDEFLREWSDLTRELDTLRLPAAVDGDADGALRDAARKEHHANRRTDAVIEHAPFRDSRDPEFDIAYYLESSALYRLEEIERSGVAIHHLVGWMDSFPRDGLLLFANLDNPQRISIGPWLHQQRHEFDDAGEHLRWFDRWLKGIDNGVDAEPPVHYYVMGAPRGQRWRSAASWPLPGEVRTTWTLAAGATAADGALTQEPSAEASVEYAVDYSTTSGTANRWRNAYGGPGNYTDRNENDAKGICFTSAPLAEDVTVVGHPVAQLEVRSTAEDGDFFVYLEEVDAEGRSHYVTEGCLRASHRALAEPPWDHLGLPFHRSYEEDLEPIPEGESVTLRIDLHPTANLFDAGHRIRVTVTCADIHNQRTPILDPAPVVSLTTGSATASYVELPVLPQSSD